MIKSVVSQGPYLVINGGYHNFPYISPGTVGAGQLRWNPNMNEMEVNDGIVWRSLGANDTSISLTNDAQDALTWAITKMQEERELKERMQRHPGLQDTWEKFKIMEALCQEQDARQSNI
jgi:hypothetical protein